MSLTQFQRRIRATSLVKAERTWFPKWVDDERLDRYGEPEIADFLTELALTGHVVAGTQNQAISSMTLYYEKVLGRELGFIHSLRAKESLYLPVVLTKSEVVATTGF